MAIRNNFSLRILALFLALVLCFGCHMSASAAQETSAPVSVMQAVDEPERTVGAGVETIPDQEGDFPPIDWIIAPEITTEFILEHPWILVIGVLLYPISVIWDALSTVFNAIGMGFEIVVYFFKNLFKIG